MIGAASTLGLPDRLAGRYRLLGSVGRGAIAEVVRAHDERTDTQVALKILYPHLRESAAVAERFRREVDIVRKIAHPHVLAIHEIVDSDGLLFLVMDYWPGGDLADRFAIKRALGAGELRVLAGQLCGALAAAHRAGVIHRDVKPSNVLCGSGPQLDVRLCDFGLARTAELSGLTTANAVLGTPEYMAPEVVVDGHADPRSDIYSLGVMLFEAATGRLPFYGDSPYQLMRQHVDVEAPRASTLAPDLPPAIDAAIARALAKDPLDRFATVEDLSRALTDDAPAAAALLVPASAPVPARRACPQCGGWLVEAAAACADCGSTLLRLEEQARGGVSVLVTGPGRPGDRIDAWRHVNLYSLLDELPSGSVPVGRGRRRAPRVPFYVARGISRRSAEALAERLRGLGFVARIDTRVALANPEARQKIWEMTKRHTLGTGVLLNFVPQLSSALEKVLPFRWLFFVAYPLVLSIYGASLAAVALRYARPIVRKRPVSAGAAKAVRVLADGLPRLRSRQDRRLVARILERLARIGVLGHGMLAQTLADRAARVVDGLASVDSLRDAEASVSRDPDRALAELRREETTRVLLRADLLRTASRLDDLCLVAARANDAASSEETARLEAEVQELALAIESEQEVGALVGDRS